MSTVLDYKIIMKDGTVHEQSDKYGTIRDAVYETIEKLYPETHLPYSCEFTLTDSEEILRFGQTLINKADESGNFSVRYIDEDDTVIEETFSIYDMRSFIELVQKETPILSVDTHVWETHSLVFPHTHANILELYVDSSPFSDKSATVSKEDLLIFINYCLRVAENEKLCFGFHVDKIKSVTIHMW